MHIITRIARENGLKAAELARLLGISRNFLSTITTCKNPLPVWLAFEIARVTDANPISLHYNATFQHVLSKYKKMFPQGEVLVRMVNKVAEAKHTKDILPYIAEAILPLSPEEEEHIAHLFLEYSPHNTEVMQKLTDLMEAVTFIKEEEEVKKELQKKKA
jgi:transcriptional regulator with XRE-family HTH domain